MDKTFSRGQLDALKKEYGAIDGIDPSSPTGKKFLNLLHDLETDQLKALSGAGIKFVSGIAKNELNRRKSKIKEEVETINELSPALKMRYIRAAEQDVAVKRIASNHALVKTGVSQSPGVVRKAYRLHNKLEKDNLKRLVKVDKVAKQITKESVDIDRIEKLVDAGDLKGIKALDTSTKEQLAKHIDSKFHPLLGIKEGTRHDSGWHKAKGTVTDKSGAKHTPMSRAHHLARLGRGEAEDEITPFKGGHKKSKEDGMTVAHKMAVKGRDANDPSLAQILKNMGKIKSKFDKVKVRESVSITEVRHPLAGHDYHKKSNDQLDYIIKDAGEAKKAMSGGHNPAAENKYADQVNDAATVKYMRQKFKGGKMPSWYAKKYGHKIAEETISELSNKLLKRYVKKAADSANKEERKVNKWFGRDDEKFSKANKKVIKRDKNIKLANRKMAE
jgi:hypothetical protein